MWITRAAMIQGITRSTRDEILKVFRTARDRILYICYITAVIPYKNRYVLHVCHIYNAFIATHVHIALVRKM